jgi:predicted nucleotidyltransferase
MTRDEIIAKIKETAPALRAEGVTQLAIFGSAVPPKPTPNTSRRRRQFREIEGGRI